MECFSPSRLVPALLLFQIFISLSLLQQSQYFALKLLVNFLKKLCLHVTLHIFTVDLKLWVLIKNNLFSLYLDFCVELEAHITLNFRDS